MAIDRIEVECSYCGNIFTGSVIPVCDAFASVEEPCPKCGAEVYAYSNRKQIEGAKDACEELERRLQRLLDEMDRDRQGIPEGGYRQALGRAAHQLPELAQLAQEEADKFLPDQDEC